MSMVIPTTPGEFIAQEENYGCHNYHPIPVVLSKGDGIYLWDVEGKKYFDFLSAYSAVNQGHCHPRLVEAVRKQASSLTLTSRAFHNDKLGPYTQFITSYFGYEMVLPMNSGVEAGESAVKICRKWGYEKKTVPENAATIVMAKNNFWGRSIAACSSSSDLDCRGGFGPYTPGFTLVEYDNVEELEKVFKTNPNVCGFYIEPIQGEAGVIVPSDGYLKKAYELCKKHNVLFIADEIQTGLCRTGKMLCCEYDGVRPDILVLGKALSGGMLPVSAVLCDKPIMECIQPGQHGSTYGGNPLACHVAMEALRILKEENLADNAMKLGKLFRERMMKLKEKHSYILEIRGRGLLNAMVISPTHTVNAWDICIQLKEAGLLAKPTHKDIIRFAPPLIINETQINAACDIIETVILAIP